MKQELSTVGIDLAKKIFHLVGTDTRGKMVWRKRHVVWPSYRKERRRMSHCLALPGNVKVVQEIAFNLLNGNIGKPRFRQ